jgi:hypothetical protein
MKLSELIKDKTAELKLHHPQIGHVVWGECRTRKGDPLGHYGLYFARGHEKYDMLVVDESIFFDDTWEIDK